MCIISWAIRTRPGEGMGIHETKINLQYYETIINPFTYTLCLNQQILTQINLDNGPWNPTRLHHRQVILRPRSEIQTGERYYSWHVPDLIECVLFVSTRISGNYGWCWSSGHLFIEFRFRLFAFEKYCFDRVFYGSTFCGRLELENMRVLIVIFNSTQSKLIGVIVCF